MASFFIGFISGGVLFFILGVLVAIYINAEGMAKMLKSGDMYIKQDGKWHPHNPFRSQEKG